MHLLFVAFVILDKNYYTNALALHLLLMEYHQGHGFCFIFLLAKGHPAFETQKRNFRNFNGEDIECFNRKLSQATVSTSARSNVCVCVLFSSLKSA